MYINAPWPPLVLEGELINGNVVSVVAPRPQNYKKSTKKIIRTVQLGFPTTLPDSCVQFVSTCQRSQLRQPIINLITLQNYEKYQHESEISEKTALV